MKVNAQRSGRRVARAVQMGIVVLTAMTVSVFAGAGSAQAADTQLGIDVGNIAYGQFTSDNADVKARLSENPAGSDCNFYTGFWVDPANDRRDGYPSTPCGKVTPGYMYRNGTKTWGNVKWASRAWCADFAKFSFYWGGAKITGLSPAASSFKTYGVNNGTWHGRGSGYVPRKGDAVVYDWTNNGSIDHVAIVTSYQDTSTDGNHYVVGGNQSGGVTHPEYANWNAAIVGYTSPVPK
ncbi:CHAP domain-containing protein [Longispora urticae]